MRDNTPKYFSKYLIRLCTITCLLLFFSACNTTRSNFPYDAKISPDGSTLALLTFETGIAALKIKKSGTSDWTKLSVPSGINSYGFMDSENSLLITYRQGEQSMLAKLSLDDGQKLTELYRSGGGLSFPKEISFGKYLVQAVARTTPDGYPIHHWLMIKSEGIPIKVGEEFGPPYSNVSLVNESGFFIVTDAAGDKKIRLFEFPNGEKPDVKRYVKPDTTSLVCDRVVGTCLQLNRYLDKDGYFFKVMRVSGSESCEVNDLPRWVGNISITSDGKNALIVGAQSSQGRPMLVLLGLGSGICANLSKHKENL